MSDFGGKLREARERRGISLRQIATKTKISITALEALERNDTSKLPGGIFSRAFVRSYAAEVGLDPDATVREFLERFHGEPSVSPATPARVSAQELAFERERHRAALVFGLAVAGMLIVAVVLYFIVLRGRPDPFETFSVPEGSGLPVANAAATEPPSEPARVAPQAPARSVSAEDEPIAAEGTMRLELHPSGSCWVSAVVDGKRVISRIMNAGEREVFEFRQQAVVTVGDAGVFAFTIDGRPGRSLGAPGEVTTARITPATVTQYLR